MGKEWIEVLLFGEIEEELSPVVFVSPVIAYMNIREEKGEEERR